MTFWEKPFEFLVSSVGQYIVDTWRQISHVDRHLNNLRDALPRGHELIRRSECWRLRYDIIDKNLPRLKDVVYEAQSIVDELEYQHVKQKVEMNRPGEFITYYFQNWMAGFPERVNQVQENLYKFCNEMEDVCNRLQIPQNHNQFSETARPITTKFGESNVFGRDKELDEVINLLGVSRSRHESDGWKRKRKHNMCNVLIGESSSSTAKKENVKIVSIVGMGGVGKTTLAQMVYNDRDINCYFEKLIWICISENFDVKRLTKEIIECLTEKTFDHTTNLNSLQENLEKTLKSKRFLLVLDDAWSENEIAWQQFLGPMKKGLEGSAILITTRLKNVVAIAGKTINSAGLIYLEGLEDHTYWEFFKNCAFSLEVKIDCFPELEKIGKQICKKLKGSPLAAKTIGGLLKSKMDVSYWSSIRDSKMWQLKQEEHDILPILQLSYQYLSSDLKRCFSFCSLYPKDYEFKKTELFRFWIMHGFISSQENSQQVLDALAGVYFDQLVERCLLQKIMLRKSDKYVIHDLLHDVCQSITKDECFCLENEYFEEKVSPDIRHLSVFQNTLNWDEENELVKYEKLLSLSIAYPSNFCPKMMENLCTNLTSIRSLSLVKCDIRKLPESIGNLKHLQILDISFSSVDELPGSFCTLYNLKYLYMEGCPSHCHFPEGLEKLVSLQIFCYPDGAILKLNSSAMNFAKAIVGKNLTIVLADGEGPSTLRIKKLKHVSFRGSLSMRNLHLIPNKEAAEEAEMNRKTLITALDLSWSFGRSATATRDENHDEEVLEGLCPHPNLKELTIRYYEGKNIPPSWLKEELTRLREFAVEHCPNVGIVSHLPRCITKLEINSCKRLTNLENCLRPEQLPVLMYLNVSNCEELISLAPMESFEGFSSLEGLTISGCPKLTCQNEMVLPPSLKRLYLASCGDLENSLPTCLQNLASLEELNLGYFLHLVSIPAEVTRSLKSLSSLWVTDCAELQSLGGLQFLASLTTLSIKQCPNLQETGGDDIDGKLPSVLLANLPSAYRVINRRRRARKKV